MKRILVTGGAGFIGANLIKRLSDPNTYITVVDNLISGVEENLAEENVHFIKADVCDLDFSQLKPHDEIYHLACPASPAVYQKYPKETLETCFIGTKNVLEFARKHQSTMVFTSTSEIYGDPEIAPQPESYRGNTDTCNIRSCYDEGKRVAETLCYEYFSKEVDVKVARVFNTYGPMMKSDDGRVISNFMLQALRNQPLTIYGTGEQTRSFCYIDDMVTGLVTLMKLEKSQEVTVVNIGSEDEKSIYCIARCIMSITGKTCLSFTYQPLPQGDPKQRRPCLKRAKSLLRWNPIVGLTEGLERTYHYALKHFDNQ